MAKPAAIMFPRRSRLPPSVSATAVRMGGRLPASAGVRKSCCALWAFGKGVKIHDTGLLLRGSSGTVLFLPHPQSAVHGQPVQGHFGRGQNPLLIVSFGSIAISMPAAYAIARIKFRGRKQVSKGILISYLMPRTVLFIPLYLLVTKIGLSNNLWGLVLVYPTITIPYATWMMISYFKSIPYDLEEAAIIDGCSRVQAMWKICFPLARPGIVSTLIFSYTLCWSEYLYALVIINKADFKTIPLALADMVVGDVYAWGPLMGGSLIASIPVIILYLLCNRNLVGGMTAGGVKG